MLVARSKGFTLVELLIVIVVVAVLAAISVVAYNGIQDRANDAAVQSNMRAIGDSIVRQTLLDGGSYPFSNDSSDLMLQLNTLAIEPAKSSYDTSGGANMLYLTNNGGRDFLLIARAKSGKAFYYSNQSGGVVSYDRNFVSDGSSSTRSRILGAANSPGTHAWGYGMSGWAPEWIH